ncbi:MAG: leucine-rich repeat domain-containing protein [Muribaculaceae bacterium]|nr:leucine-rich repeat domain-containing protein [Muribaculaceae bacterium]
MKTHLAMLLGVFAFAASARSLHVTPGTLSGLLSPTPSEASGNYHARQADDILILTGSLDARDFESLRSLEGVRSLDLSDVSIMRYSCTEPLFPGGTLFEEATLPPYALFGLQVEQLTLPASLRSISRGALAATSVRTLSVPEGVTEIGADAFYDSPLLEKITLPASLTSLGARAMANCPSLRSVNLDATSVTSLPERVLAATPSLRQVGLSKIRQIGREALSGSGLTYLMLPEARELAPFALSGMPELQAVSIRHDAIMAEGILMDSPSLTEVNGVPDILPDLFTANCTTFSPAGVMATATSIGRFAFANTGADFFVLSREVAQIRQSAFAGCSSLYGIDARQLAAFTPEVDPSAFDGICTADVTLIVKEGCEMVWSNHPVWGMFNITSSTSGVEAVEPDPDSVLSLYVAAGEVTGRTSEGSLSLAVYDIDGHRVRVEASPDSEIRIPLAELPKGILLLNLTDSHGAWRRIKIIN